MMPTFVFLLIELFDELNYAVQGAALPVIRTDLGLSYAQIGLLLGAPHIIGTALIEPLIMLLGDTRLRKALVVSGGLFITLALLATAGATGFPLLLVASVISFPASGAFVTLAQATLVDLNPGREPHMMARWTLAGSIGNLLGAAMLAGALALGWSWRWVLTGLALLALSLVVQVWRMPFPQKHPRQIAEMQNPATHPHLREDVRNLLLGLKQAAGNLNLIRWLILLLLSDLMMDVLTGYLPLYFIDVVGVNAIQSGLLLSLFMAASLASDMVLVPLLERAPGRRVVRVSATVVAVLYTAWLLLPGSATGAGLWSKVVLMFVIKLATLGWYSVLQGEAYASMPGRSGTVMALNSFSGVLGGIIPWAIGAIANQAGLPAAMWLLLLGPLSLLLFVPKTKSGAEPAQAADPPTASTG